MIYLDNAATTPISKSVLDAMMPYLTERYGNPGSSHSLGRAAAEAVAKAREQVGRLINAKPENIIFTSGGSEGNHFALLSRAEELLAAGKNHVLISSVEHDSVVRAAERLTKLGFHVEELPVNSEGCVLFDAVKSYIRPETGLISIMYVNNEVGSANDVFQIGSYCNEHNILFHTDCVQAAGFKEIDVQTIGCDFATTSSHKLYGPKGVGAVYVKEPEKCCPLFAGGHNQEFGLRGGTENVAGIVGFGQACEDIKRAMDNWAQTNIPWLRSMFLITLFKYVDHRSIHINGYQEPLSSSRVLNLQLDDVDGETLLVMLDSAGVCVSSGSACRAKEPEPSRTLIAMGVPPEDARNCVRISFGNHTTGDEVRRAAEIMGECVNTLRDLTYDSED